MECPIPSSYESIQSIEVLKGQKILGIYEHPLSESVIVETEEEVYMFTHFQDCCEGVYLEEIAGDLQWLLGERVTNAMEESSSQETDYGSETITFYSISTRKGTVTFRFYGESNGYYSEDAYLVPLPKDTFKTMKKRPLESSKG